MGRQILVTRKWARRLSRLVLYAFGAFFFLIVAGMLTGCGVDDTEFTFEVNEDVNVCMEMFEEPCAVVPIPFSKLEYVEAVLTGEVVR